MVATTRQRLKANDETEREINFQNIDTGPDTDEKGNPNPPIVKFNASNKTSEDVGNLQR